VRTPSRARALRAGSGRAQGLFRPLLCGPGSPADVGRGSPRGRSAFCTIAAPAREPPRASSVRTRRRRRVEIRGDAGSFEAFGRRSPVSRLSPPGARAPPSRWAQSEMVRVGARRCQAWGPRRVQDRAAPVPARSWRPPPRVLTRDSVRSERATRSSLGRWLRGAPCVVGEVSSSSFPPPAVGRSGCKSSRDNRVVRDAPRKRASGGHPGSGAFGGQGRFPLQAALCPRSSLGFTSDPRRARLRRRPRTATRQWRIGPPAIAHHQRDRHTRGT